MGLDELGLVGRTIDGIRYDACVDAGGFGLVYRAVEEATGTTIAIKCLKLPYATRSDAALRASVEGRFQDEAKILSRLAQGHPDIVRCTGSGTLVAPATAERTPYMVLEWLDGRTLSSELRERRTRLPIPTRTLDEAIALLDPAVSAIAYAHAHDVVHRDVKPGNIFLARVPDGTVRAKVLDFGLAKILAEDLIGMKQSVETAMGVQFCSPSYGAPEQFSPKIGPIGPWTDVYALTFVLLELMNGTKVRHATSLAEGALHALDPHRASPSPSSLGLSLPRAVEELLLRAVAQNPLERPRDAGVFWKALRDALGGGRASPAELGRTMVDPRAASSAQALAGTMLHVPLPHQTALPTPAAPQSPAPARAFTGTVLLAPAAAAASLEAARAHVAAVQAHAPLPRVTSPLASSVYGQELSPVAAPPAPKHAPGTSTPAYPPRPPANVASAPPAPGPAPSLAPAGVPRPGMPAWLVALVVIAFATLLATAGYALWLTR